MNSDARGHRGSAKLVAGGVAGLAAALAYGIVMHAVTMPMPMGGSEPMLAMVARVVRSDSLAVAWVVLLFSGAIMGGLYGILLGDRASRLGAGLLWGVVYGVAWWVGATLVLMPVLLDMPAFAPLTMASMRAGAMVGLAAYVLSGAILGGVFAGLYGRGRSRPRAAD